MMARVMPSRGAVGVLVALAVIGCGDDDPEAPPPAPGTIVGRLVDEAGAPLGGEVVLACMATICLTTDSAPDGAFRFEGDVFEPPVDIAMKAPPSLSGSPRRAAALYPFRMEVGETALDVGTLRVPSLPAGAPIDLTADVQQIAAGDGLELVVQPAALTPPLGYPLDALAARRVPVEWMPPITALAGEVLVAVYALHPFGATSTAPVGVRVPSDLPAGTRVWFRSLSDLDGSCSPAVPGRADGRAVATEPGAGVTALTWLVVSR